jgi:RHS repeat-associated protein
MPVLFRRLPTLRFWRSTPVSNQFKYTYRLNGQYDTVTFPNGQTRSYSYDDQGRLLSLANALGATNLATYAYGYDVDNATGQSTMLGQRTSLTANVPTQSFANALTKYYYDSLYQLTRADYPAAAPFNGEIDSWTYDAIGNRLTNTVNGSAQTYTYFKNGANPLNGQRLSSDGVNAYTWDSNGSNLTRNGGPGNFTFGYNVDNRLNAIAGAATAVYTYDYQGRRTSKTVGGTTTTYLYDGLNLVGETAGATITSYAFGPGIDEPLIVNKAGTISYFNSDGLGSIAGTNSPSGTFDYNSIFDAWGSIRSETGTRTNSFTYTGREVGEAGLHSYRARFLDPARGRFTQEDPRGLKGASPSLYEYAVNRPTSLIDPMGLTAGGRRPGPPPAPPPVCHNCGPNGPRVQAAVSGVCSLLNTAGSACRAMVKKYDMLFCFTQNCMTPIDVVCMERGCGGCGGPCGIASDPTAHIFLQPDAFGEDCGPLQDTVAHEMAHMCGVGPDVHFPENRLKADNIGAACSGK